MADEVHTNDLPSTPMFNGEQVCRSIRFNHDHKTPGHPTEGFLWRIIDRQTGTQVFAKDIVGRCHFNTESEEVNGEVKGNITVLGRFYLVGDQVHIVP